MSVSNILCCHPVPLNLGEGEEIDIEEISRSVAISISQENTKLIGDKYKDIAELVLDSRDASKPLSKKRLFYWHKLIFAKNKGISRVASWRETEMKVVLGPLHKIATEYVAPPPERVDKEISDYLEWLEGSESSLIPVAIKSAIAHLWFETIHPFDDGNGRIGRAICDYIINQSEIFRNAPFSLSKAILNKRKEYYKQLKNAQSIKDEHEVIDVTGFIEWFLETTEDAIDFAKDQALFVTSRNHFFIKYSDQLNERQEKVLRKLFAFGKERLDQGISAKPYAKIANTSPATATRDLADLARKGVLIKSEKGGRSTFYKLSIVIK